MRGRRGQVAMTILVALVAAVFVLSTLLEPVMLAP
jgi:hypothetical protein